MTTTAQNILKTLGYFDLFQYPLTRPEISVFHPAVVPLQELETALETLLTEKTVFRLDEFYSLSNDHLLVERRRRGNLLAVKQLKTAQRVAKFLSRFPYVKAVAVSGSLSKNFASDKTDIDLFIITAPNRLWIARTCMHLFKKLTFLTGRQHRYCMNYYVDEQEPEITEKNIFTAIEIITLLPMQGRSSLDEFIAANEWVKKYFPAHHFQPGEIPEIQPGFLRKTFERIFNGRMGDRFDRWLMKITKARWQKKADKRQLNSKGIRMGMVVGRHFSKPDPRNFQDKVIERYQVRVQQLIQLQNRIASVVL